MNAGMRLDSGKCLVLLSVLTLMSACTPATRFTMVDGALSSAGVADGVASVQDGSAIIEEPIVEQPVAQQPSAPAGNGSIAAAPAANEIIPNQNTKELVVTEEVPFSFAYNDDRCIDFSNDPLKFNLIKEEGGVRSAKVTSLPLDSKGQIDWGNYSIYALYADENGAIHPSLVYTEATVDEKRVYGYFNCNLQTSRVKELSDKLGISGKDVAAVSELHMLVKGEEAGLVGFAARNQITNTLTMRCYK